MDFFDDETSHAQDASSGSRTAPPSRRRQPNRRRTRIQRLVILALVLFIIVFAMAWWARSCQHNRKVGTYESYFSGVSTAIDDSAKLGKQLNAIMADPTKYSRKQLTAKLDELTNKQAEIAVRASHLDPPSTLTDEQTVFATGMKVRASGFKQLQAKLIGALDNKKVTVKSITSLDGYFSGPDAYYQELVYLPSREAMENDGVSGVAVPTSTYYLTWKALEPETVSGTLTGLGKSPKMTGIHGVALTGVTAKSSSETIALAKGSVNKIPASTDLTFVVKVQNQGSVTERNVPVTATLTLPDGSTTKQEASLATVASGKTQAATVTGFTIPSEALTKVVKLRVTAGPVEGEAVESNNSATYKLLLQLK